jgi:hypothetical protein
MTDAISELCDRVSRVTHGGVAFTVAQELFTQNEEFRVPRTVLSLAPFNGPSQVTLRL